MAEITIENLRVAPGSGLRVPTTVKAFSLTDFLLNDADHSAVSAQSPYNGGVPFKSMALTLESTYYYGAANFTLPSTTDSPDNPNGARWGLFVYDANDRLMYPVAGLGSFQLDDSPATQDAEDIRAFNDGVGTYSTTFSAPALSVSGTSTFDGPAIFNGTVSGAVKSFMSRDGIVTLQSSDLNGLDPSGMAIPPAGSSTGHSATGTVTIDADNDSDDVGVIDFKTRTVTRGRFENAGGFRLFYGLSRDDVIEDAATFAGADAGAKIQAAHDALPAIGGTVDARGLHTAQTLSAITITKPCTLLFGYGVYTFAAGAKLTVSGQKNVTIKGMGMRNTTLVAASGQPCILYAGLTTGSSANRDTRVSDMSLHGSGGGTYGINVPDISGGVFSMFGGQSIFERIEATGFSSYGIYVGVSSYTTYIDACFIKDNGTGIYLGASVDGVVTRTQFTYPRDNPLLSIGGSQLRITHNIFDRGTNGTGSTGLGVDIEFRDGVSAGNVIVTHNKFGTEGDVSNRYKLATAGVNPTTYVQNLLIAHNEFLGVPGQTMFNVLNPLLTPQIISNNIDGFLYHIRDAQGISGDVIGGGIYRDNAVKHTLGQATHVYVNGGRDFTDTLYPPGTTGVTIPNPGLSTTWQNRLRNSEDFTSVVDSYSWSKAAATTLTTGVADPGGGTRAVNIAKTATASQYLRARIDTASLLTDTLAAASGANGRAVLDVWLKAGTTLTSVSILVIDSTTSAIVYYSVGLTPQWKKHSLPITGIDPSHTITLYFYPGGVSGAVAGDINMALPVVSDYGSDLYVKTGGAMANGAKSGTVTLVAGVVTVNNTSVSADSKIRVYRKTDGGTVGASYSRSVIAGTSFTITSKDGAGATQTADTSILDWVIDVP